jgi:hypothetical protein
VTCAGLSVTYGAVSLTTRYKICFPPHHKSHHFRPSSDINVHLVYVHSCFTTYIEFNKPSLLLLLLLLLSCIHITINCMPCIP